MTYRIKPEFLDMWEGGETPSDPGRVLTEDDVNRMANEWGMPAYSLQDQLIPCNGEYPFWFAVQRDRDDDWGTGSYMLSEAKRMAAGQQCEYPDTLIAVIENDTCIDEITEF